MIREADFDDVAFVTALPRRRTLPIVLEVVGVPLDRACRELSAGGQLAAVEHVIRCVADGDRLVDVFAILAFGHKTCDIRRIEHVLVAVFVEVCCRTFVDLRLRGLSENLISVLARSAAYRVDNRVCHVAQAVRHVGAERVLAAGEGNSHKVGKLCHILGAFRVDIHAESLFAVRTVVVSIESFDGLQFLVVGDVDGDCVEHRVERIAVHVACKTSAVFVRRFGICRRQINGRRIPNDISTRCVLILTTRVVGRHLSVLNPNREVYGCFLREERCVKEETVSEFKVFSCAAGYRISLSGCRIFDNDFRRRLNADVCRTFGVVELQHARRERTFIEAVRRDANHEEVPCLVDVGRSAVRAACRNCTATACNGLHVVLVGGLGSVVLHCRADTVLFAVDLDFNRLNTGFYGFVA